MQRWFIIPVFFFAACDAGPNARSGDDDPEAALADLLACHDAAVGGVALRNMDRVEYDLEIVEPGFSVEGQYWAERRGAVRIDIFAAGERVFSEGWDGIDGWQLPQGATGPVPTSAEGAAALRHGVESPGHLWTLRDMSPNGHSIEWAEELDSESSESRVLRVTLEDGFEGWYWLDRESCLVTRTRDFRAFHPDVDPDARWIETRFDDFQTDEGVTRPWTNFNIDLVSGDTIGRTRIKALRYTRR